MALAALASIYVNAADNFVQRTCVWLLFCPSLTPIMFVMLGFAGGLVLFAWQIYQYLRFGNWPGWNVAHQGGAARSFGQSCQPPVACFPRANDPLSLYMRE